MIIFGFKIHARYEFSQTSVSNLDTKAKNLQKITYFFKCSFYEKHVGPMLSAHFKEMGHNGEDPKAYFIIIKNQ